MVADTSYTFKLTVSSTQTAGNNIALDTLELQASSMPTSDDDQWYYLHFGNPSPTPPDWETDSNGDGYSNYFAYALGGSPHWFDPSMLPVIEAASPGFNYLFNRRLAIDPAAYVAESSLDLQAPWVPLTGATAIPHPDLPDYERGTVPLPDDEPLRFVRLQIN